jgi:thioredoxin 1
MSEVRQVGAVDWDAEVLGSRRPVLVDLWAAWCAPCGVVGPIVDEIAGDRAGSLDVFKLNVDEDPEVAMRYGVSSIPTLLVFRDGAEVGRARRRRFAESPHRSPDRRGPLGSPGVTWDEARRLSGREVPRTDEVGPDPTEDPILYLKEVRKEDEEKKRWTSGS